MFLLGFLALMQSIIIPGALILKAMEFKGSFIQKLVYMVALSLVTTYMIVLVLTLLGIYHRWSVLVLIFVEFFVFIRLYRFELKTHVGHFFIQIWKSFIQAIQRLLSTLENVNSFPDFANALVMTGAFIFSTIALWWSVKIIIHYAGTIFNAWDVVISWNQWALSWVNGAVPLETRNYPQLIPANWSLSYILIGNAEVQFFAKALVLPFAFLILLMIFDLGIETRAAGFFLGTVLTYLILKKFLEPQLTNGYVDGAMAYFSLLPVYTLIKALSVDDDNSIQKLLFLGAIFAGTAAIVKQPGIYVFLVYPALAYFGVIRPSHPIPVKTLKKLIYWSLGISLILASHWYIFKQIMFIFGIDKPEIIDLSRIAANQYGNIGTVPQIIAAVSLFGKYIFLFPLIVIGVIFLPPIYRWLTLLVILPYPILWALVASYDTRNLSVLLPILGLTAGVSLDIIFQFLLNAMHRVKLDKANIYALLFVVITLLVILNSSLPSSFFYDHQDTLQKQILSSSLNAKLYDLLSKEDTDVYILTNYPVSYLPDLENVQVKFDYHDYDIFVAWLDNPSIKYLLVPHGIDPKIASYLDEKIAAGDYRLLFEDRQWKYYRMIEIIKR